MQVTLAGVATSYTEALVVNIEQKNALLLSSLVVLVLLVVAGAGWLLLRDHVAASIGEHLDHAENLVVKAQRDRFDNLITVARSLREQASLIAATERGEVASIQASLEDLILPPGVDFLAVYLDRGSAAAAVVSGSSQRRSDQMLSSTIVTNLKGRLRAGEPLALGAVLSEESCLQLVFVPLESPLDGRRVGGLLAGKRFDQADLLRLRQLVYVELAMYQGSQLLASSIEGLKPSVHLMNLSSAAGEQASLELGNRRYSIRTLPILNQVGAKEQPLQLLLAADHSRYWSPYMGLGRNTLYISMLALLLAALFAIYTSRRSLTRPVQLLARATQIIGDGNMDIKLSLRRNDELGRLADSFNSMLKSLKARRGDLERNRQRFRDFASSSSDWLWETDSRGHFTFVSSSVSETLGMSAETWLGRTPAEVFPGSSLGELTRLLRPTDMKARGFKEIEIWVHALAGEAHCLRLNGVPVFSGKSFVGYRGTARDITKLKQDEKRMLILANQDHLTGLSNRRRFLEDLDHEIRRVERHGQLGVLLLIDLDHLKLLNDTAGHAAGDQIIVQVAGLLKRASRDQDFLARISGDEFAVAYSTISEEDGLNKAQQLLERINSLRPKYGGRVLNITASVGLVTFPLQGKVPVELMAKADAAMSVAKSSGRNRVHRYDETDMMRERMDNQLVWKDRLLEALECDALHLVFQPIVGLSNGTIHHYEVLVRMVEEDGALVPPGKFVPAAEQFGLIQRLDRVVVSKAIRYLADLPDELRDVGFSINLSGLSVGRHDMYDLIEHELHESGVDPARVTFEITETAACEQLNNAVSFIQRLRQLGCLVSLDDFGVGFSSFSYLKHLHADVLKIDGSFIRDIHNNNADQLFVKALVDVARGMGMHTIAEFVENEQVFERVRSLGVDYAQGYYLGKPQPRLEQLSETVAGGISASVA